MTNILEASEPKLDPPYKELIKVGSGWEYGSKHEHKEVSKILGIPYGIPEYYENVNAAELELTKIGKRIVNIYKEGYYVLKPGEQTVEVAHDMRGAVGRMRGALSHWHDAATHDMDDTEQEKHERVGVASFSLFSSVVNSYNGIAAIAGIQRKQKLLMKKKE